MCDTAGDGRRVNARIDVIIPLDRGRCRHRDAGNLPAHPISRFVQAIFSWREGAEGGPQRPL
jgi:hypothetical protein